MKHYFTAPIKGYAKAVSSIYNEFMTRIAPKLPGLTSGVTEPPGPRPEVKKWYGDYSKEEREAILKGGTPAAPALPQAPANDVDELIKKLVASPLSDMVKRGLLKSSLPTSKVLVVLNSNSATHVDKVEFARVASSILDRHLDVDARVCSSDDDVQIQCSGLGTEIVLTGAIQAVCDLISEGMRKRVGAIIHPTAVAGESAYLDEVGFLVLAKNRRMFNLKRLANG